MPMQQAHTLGVTVYVDKPELERTDSTKVVQRPTMLCSIGQYTVVFLFLPLRSFPSSKVITKD